MAQHRYDVATNGYAFRLTAHGPIPPERSHEVPALMELAEDGPVTVVFAHRLAGHDGGTIDGAIARLEATIRALRRPDSPG